MEELLGTAMLPKAVAVMKCKGHQTTNSQVNNGNKAADVAAKQAGGYLPAQMVQTAVAAPLPSLTETDIQAIQEQAGPYEHSV